MIKKLTDNNDIMKRLYFRVVDSIAWLYAGAIIMKAIYTADKIK